MFALTGKWCCSFHLQWCFAASPQNDVMCSAKVTFTREAHITSEGHITPDRSAQRNTSFKKTSFVGRQKTFFDGASNGNRTPPRGFACAKRARWQAAMLARGIFLVACGLQWASHPIIRSSKKKRPYRSVFLLYKTTQKIHFGGKTTQKIHLDKPGFAGSWIKIVTAFLWFFLL